MNDRSRRAGSHKLPAEDSYCILISMRVRPDQYRSIEAAAKKAGINTVGPFCRDLLGEALEQTGQDNGAWEKS